MALRNVINADPERLSGSGGHALERALLDSLHAVQVPPDAKGVVWGSLSAHMVASSAASAGSLWRLASKSVAASKAVLLVPMVAAGFAVAALHYGSVPAPSNPAMPPGAVLAATATQPAAPAPLAPEADTEAREREAPQRSSATAHTKDHLARESAALTRARAELRAGGAAAARSTLTRMQQKFGTGGLSQEREVLAIEALAAQGNAAEAQRLTRGFIAAHPESPHRAALQRFLR